MENLKDKKVLFYCTGAFHPFALKLAESFGRVYYYTYWQTGFPCIEDALVGSEWEDGQMLEDFDGLPLTRVESFFDYVDDVDLIVFPDCYTGDIAEYFKNKGKAVFSSMRGGDLEIERYDAKQLFKQAGIDVKPTKRIIGVDKLKEYLKKSTGKKWIKISKYRKCFETFCCEDYRMAELEIDRLAYKLSPFKNIIEFLVEDDIPKAVEEGIDTFSVHGEYPENCVAGVENKGLAYCGMCYPYEELTEGIKKVNKKLAPLFKEFEYQGAFSTEIRTTDNGEHFLLEPTARFPSPPSELYAEMYKDIGNIVWEIGNGRMPKVECEKKYGLEMVLNVNFQDDESTHLAIYFPEEIRKYIKIKNPIKVDGQYYSLLINGISDVGSIVVTGDSIEECRKEMEEVFNQVKVRGLTSEMSHIDDAIEEFRKMNGK